MDDFTRLMIGPSAIPHRVLKAMNRQIISHRTDEYSEIQSDIEESLKLLFRTKNPILTLTASGTGAMEASIDNLLKPGDEVVIPINGNFGKRFAEICTSKGILVNEIPFALGDTINPTLVMNAINSNTTAVLLVHNESTTGVVNDVKTIGNALKETPTLTIVDTVSGLGGLEMKMDDWGLDCVLSASQKALMAPPGLSFVALSEKAIKKTNSIDSSTFYFDFKKALEYLPKHQTPWTPAVSLMFGIHESLKMILEEGLENVLERHKNNTKLIREGCRDLGYRPLINDDRYASPTVTSILADGFSNEIVSYLKNEKVIIGKGLAPLNNKIFRVGTMGHVYKKDIDHFFSALRTFTKVK